MPASGIKAHRAIQVPVANLERKFNRLYEFSIHPFATIPSCSNCVRSECPISQSPTPTIPMAYVAALLLTSKTDSRHYIAIRELDICESRFDGHVAGMVKKTTKEHDEEADSGDRAKEHTRGPVHKYGRDDVHTIP